MVDNLIRVRLVATKPFDRENRPFELRLGDLHDAGCSATLGAAIELPGSYPLTMEELELFHLGKRWRRGPLRQKGHWEQGKTSDDQ
jgi:hypothetical protein